MRDETDLHAQVAQRLFGWRYQATEYMYVDRAGFWHADLPAYTTNPAATALVWQWLEGQQGIEAVSFCYTTELSAVVCDLSAGGRIFPVCGEGATWPEALCRAALALAEALEQREEEG